jgi:hypothetical protein
MSKRGRNNPANFVPRRVGYFGCKKRGLFWMQEEWGILDARRGGYLGCKQRGLFWMLEEWGVSGCKKSGLFCMQEEWVI